MALWLALGITRWIRPLSMPSYIYQYRRVNSQDIIIKGTQWTRKNGPKVWEQREGYKQVWLEELRHLSWKFRLLNNEKENGEEEPINSTCWITVLRERFVMRTKLSFPWHWQKRALTFSSWAFLYCKQNKIPSN